MAPYPLTVRNRAPWFLRGVMIGFIGLVLTPAIGVFNARSTGAVAEWPLVLALCAAVCVGLLVGSFFLESGELIVEARGRVRLTRGPPWHRTTVLLDRASLSIGTETDSDGDPDFKLLIDAPGGRMIVAQNHRRGTIEALQRRIQAAFAG